MANKGMTALRESSQLSVEISELLRDPGSSKHLEFTEEVPGLALDMGRVEPILAFELDLESLVDGVMVDGSVRGSYRLQCIRCLAEFDRAFELRLSELLAFPGQPGAEEGYQVSGAQAHLEPLVRDALLLSMPVNPLHDPGCKGLCPRCGLDRNTTDCGHGGERVDLRWEPLERLKERLGADGSAVTSRPRTDTRSDKE